MLLLARSMRIKGGAPRSAGRPLKHAAPGSQSSASTVAHMMRSGRSVAANAGAKIVKQPITAAADASRFICAPLFDRVTTAFHACAVGSVVGVHRPLPVGLGLVVSRCLVLPSPAPTDHRAGDSANGCALARIARDCTDRKAAHSATGRAAGAFATTRGRPALLRYR